MAEGHAPGFSAKPTLIGDSVVLRPFILDEDASALREMLQDPDVIKLTGVGSGPGDVPQWDQAAEGRFLEWYSTRNEQSDRLDLAVVDKASGQCVGEVVLNNWNEATLSCGFRIALGPRGRDRGLGTGAARMIVEYGFEHLGLHRISLEVFSFNPRAQARLREDRLRCRRRRAPRAPLGQPVDRQRDDVDSRSRLDPRRAATRTETPMSGAGRQRHRWQHGRPAA